MLPSTNANASGFFFFAQCSHSSVFSNTALYLWDFFLTSFSFLTFFFALAYLRTVSVLLMNCFFPLKHAEIAFSPVVCRKRLGKLTTTSFLFAWFLFILSIVGSFSWQLQFFLPLLLFHLLLLFQTFKDAFFLLLFFFSSSLSRFSSSFKTLFSCFMVSWDPAFSKYYYSLRHLGYYYQKANNTTYTWHFLFFFLS